jgi:uncharacterized protein YllA (UPF0747 family)
MMRIPFGNLPSMSALFLDYVSDWTRVRGFYPQDYSLKSILAFARNRPPLDSSHRGDLCLALTEQQRDWGGDAASIKKLDAGAVAVIAGQQPGLFTGPNYTILKATTIVKLARALDEAGVPAVPVFWITGEDHDHEEIEWASVLDRDSRLERIAVDLSTGEKTPSAWLRLGEDVGEAVSKCLSILPDSEFQQEVGAVLKSAYKPGVSPVDAFARMMSKLFDGSGLILVNPLHPGLRVLAAPKFDPRCRRKTVLSLKRDTTSR